MTVIARMGRVASAVLLVHLCLPTGCADEDGTCTFVDCTSGSDEISPGDGGRSSHPPNDGATSGDAGATSRDAGATNVPREAGLKTYLSKTRGYSFSYPDTWTLTERSGNPTVATAALRTSERPRGAELFVLSEPARFSSLRESSEALRASAERTIPGVRLESGQTTTIGGLPALTMVLRDSREDALGRWIVVHHDARQYDIVLQAFPSAAWSMHQPTLHRILASFRWSPARERTGSDE